MKWFTPLSRRCGPNGGEQPAIMRTYSRACRLPVSRGTAGVLAASRYQVASGLEARNAGSAFNPTGGCDMTRLIAAAALLLATVAPVFACDFTKSSATDSQSTTASSNANPAPHSRS
jgi:hypothetical protein